MVMVTIMSKRKQGLTKKQKALLREIEKDPEASLHEIGSKMKVLGVVKDENYPYQITKKNQNIREKITILQEKAELKSLKRDPKALKVIDLHLAEGNLEAAKTIFKANRPNIDDSKRPIPQQTVNILAIREYNYNSMIAQDDDNEAIDVTSSDSNE